MKPELDPVTVSRLYQAALLAVGGLLFGVADLLAGWLLSLFGSTVALPAQADIGLATALFAGLVYAVALHTDANAEDAPTLLERLFGTAGEA